MKFSDLINSSNRIKELDDWRKLSPNLYTRFDFENKKLLVRMNNQIIFINEKNGEILYGLFKELFSKQ